MTVNSFARNARRGGWPATFALILVVGCENARTPLELARPYAQPAPPHVTSVVSVAGGAADRNQETRIDALNEVSRRIQSAPEGRRTRVRRTSFAEERVARATAPSADETHPGPASETADEAVALIEFGTEIRMPFGGPFTVTAYTIASRPTHISHVIHVTKVQGGRTYTSTFNDDSGFLHQTSLFSSVGVSGDCATFTTLDAKTDHSAGSLTFARQLGFSTDNESCGTPGDSCGGEEGGPDDATVQGGGSDDAMVAGDCTGGGPAPGGGTTRYTCYTTVTDYYWYYPDTNTYEYRYSEETTWCEEAAA